MYILFNISENLLRTVDNEQFMVKINTESFICIQDGLQLHMNKVHGNR